MNLGSLVFLILFAISTLFIYLAVRRGWTRIVSASIVGGLVNSLLFMLYSLARGNLFIQALIVGFLVGLFFTAPTISIASFFRNNAPEAR